MPWKPTDETGTSKSVAIHAALVETENGAAIVYFGWGNPKTFLYDATPSTPDNPINDADRVDVANGDPIDSQGLAHMFCGSESFLADGRLVVAGGIAIGLQNQNLPHDVHEHDSGERRSYVYSPLANSWTAEGEIADLCFQPIWNPAQNRWEISNSLGGGRWYPTVITLGNGEAFASGGHPFIGVVTGTEIIINEEGEEEEINIVDATGADNSPFPEKSGSPRHNNNTPERFSPTTGKWTLIVNQSTANDDHSTDEYPRIHLAPSGHVFYSTLAKDKKRFYDAFSGSYTTDNVEPGHGNYFAGSEATSVLLPILPNDSNNIWVLACGSDPAQVINIASTAVPVWLDTGDRQPINGERPVRRHACSVLLPTGQVFLTGGVGAGDPAPGFLVPELYTPSINWNAGIYTPGATGTWQSLTNEPATVLRGYHGAALLLPDGRVWTAGSTEGGDEQQIEIYEPAYFAVQNRPVIADDVPMSSGYGRQITFTMESGTPARVALIRCGAMTHAFDSDQRYVGLNFNFNDENNTVNANIPNNPDLVPPGMYMLWVINANGNPCRESKFIRICDQFVKFRVNRSTFSRDETEAFAEGGVTTFTSILRADFECFRPGELGFPDPNIQTRLRWDSTSGNTIDSSLMEIVFTGFELENSALPPDVAQRITCVFDLVIKDIAIFDEVTMADRPFNARVRIGRNFADTLLELTTEPNPYMIDIEGGNEHWLSSDVRVFKIKPGQTKFDNSVTFNSGDTPLEFLNELLGQLNEEAADEPDANQHTFKKLPTAQDDPDGVMELSQLVDGTFVNGIMVGGNPIFNFAIAKVRYVSNSTDISNVKVFFRLFNTVGTALEYNSQTTYRRAGSGADTIALLGKVGPSIISIPFFAETRVTPGDSMTEQPDLNNTKSMDAKGATESIAYFGCWLDINQTTPQIPTFPLNDGPFNDVIFPFNPVSIQQLVRNYHQCLLAELFFESDKIPDVADPQNSASAATPANHENLAQRNVAVSKSGNPGSRESRTVQTTFVARSSPTATDKFIQKYVTQDRRQAFDLRRNRVPLPDELMFSGKNLPEGSRITVYMPEAKADDIIRLASQRLSPVKLEKIDDRTVSFIIDHTAYVPMPGGKLRNFAGLLSVELPEGVQKGEVYSLKVHQYSGPARQKLIGSFTLLIPVETEDDLLQDEVRKLSVLRHIFASIHVSEPWYPVFLRYLGQIEDRVSAFGGDPERVIPSPSGSLPGPRPEKPETKSFEGKVKLVLYDCFGEFKGFVLQDCRGSKTFSSCQKGIERIAVRACKDKSTLRVNTDNGKQGRILSIIIVCC